MTLKLTDDEKRRALALYRLHRVLEYLPTPGVEACADSIHRQLADLGLAPEPEDQPAGLDRSAEERGRG